jgi:hypothetical protein
MGGLQRGLVTTARPGGGELLEPPSPEDGAIDESLFRTEGQLSGVLAGNSRYHVEDVRTSNAALDAFPAPGKHKGPSGTVAGPEWPDAGVPASRLLKARVLRP